MDRGLYVAMTGAKQIMQAQAVNNHNIANINTVGFRADSVAFYSQPIYGAGYPYAGQRGGGRFRHRFVERRHAEHGPPLDLAINGKGYIAVRARTAKRPTPGPATSSQRHGMVTTSAGLPVITESGPLNIPPANSITVGNDGTVSVLSVGLSPEAASRRPIASKWSTRRKRICRRATDGLLRTQGRQQRPHRSHRDAHLGNARVEQRQFRAIADQHDRAAAPVRVSGEEHELHRSERTSGRTADVERLIAIEPVIDTQLDSNHQD